MLSGAVDDRCACDSQVMAAKGIPVVHAYNESVPLWQMHRDNGAGHECTRFCFPGAPVVSLCSRARALSNS